MSYLKKTSLPQQQHEIRKLIDERLESEESTVKKRIYQWLNNNQYFVDNELFDFYFCVAQNIAAVEVMGASGDKIVKAKNELEQSAEAYKIQIVDTSNWINEQLERKLKRILDNQKILDSKLVQVIERFTKENQNLQIISTGLVNSTSTLLKKQKKMLIQTEVAERKICQAVILGWITSGLLMLGSLATLFLMRSP